MLFANRPSSARIFWRYVFHAVTAFARTLAVRFDTRNGNNGVSHRLESRMAAEAAGLLATGM